MDDVCTGLSEQGSLDEVSLEIGDVTLVWDDGKLVKAHKEVEEVLGTTVSTLRRSRQFSMTDARQVFLSPRIPPYSRTGS